MGVSGGRARKLHDPVGSSDAADVFRQGFPEAEAVAIAVLDLEVTAVIWLVERRADDAHAFGPELVMQRVRIVDPDVRIPRTSLRIHDAVGPDHAARFERGQHDDHAAALYHAERRRVVPEPLVPEAEAVAIVVRGGDDVVDDQIWRDGPPGRR